METTGNMFSDTVCPSVCEALKSNTTLTELDLDGKDKTRKRNSSIKHSFLLSKTNSYVALRDEGASLNHALKRRRWSYNEIIIMNTKKKKAKRFSIKQDIISEAYH